MAKTENSSGFNYCITCDGKSRDDPQLYEPLIHHVLQKKKLVDGLKKEALWSVSTLGGRRPQGEGRARGRAGLLQREPGFTQCRGHPGDFGLDEWLDHLGGCAEWMNWLCTCFSLS